MHKITTLTNPRQVVLITSRWKGKDNVMTADWHMPLSFGPMMYAVAIGKTRYSLELIRKSGCFVVNFIPKEMEKQAVYCGYHTGKDKDKFKASGLGKEESESIDCPRIKGALACLECKVEEEKEVGDHILFIVSVSATKFVKRGLRLFHLWGKNFTTTERFK
ncbi:MAG: flavin reductase family protein [Candidatus Aenigmatarchaeota archaeon]